MAAMFNTPKAIKSSQGRVIESLDDLAMEVCAGRPVYVNGIRVDSEVFEYSMFGKVRQIVMKGMARKVVLEPTIKMVSDDLE